MYRARRPYTKRREAIERNARTRERVAGRDEQVETGLVKVSFLVVALRIASVLGHVDLFGRKVRVSRITRTTSESDLVDAHLANV